MAVNDIIREWEIGEVRFTLRRITYPTTPAVAKLLMDIFMKNSWLCGYVTVSSDKLGSYEDKDTTNEITYLSHNPDGTTTIGFDKNHASDWDNPLSDNEDAVARECEQLAYELGLLSEVNDR